MIVTLLFTFSDRRKSISSAVVTNGGRPTCDRSSSLVPLITLSHKISNHSTSGSLTNYPTTAFHYSTKTNKANMKRASPANTIEDLRRENEKTRDCLKHCESIISTLLQEMASKKSSLARSELAIAALQQEVISKDQKIMIMSVELASAKAQQDEYHLRSNKKATLQSLASELAYTPARSVHNRPGDAVRPRPKPRSGFSQSWNVYSNKMLKVPSQNDCNDNSSPRGSRASSRRPIMHTRHASMGRLDESFTSKTLSDLGQLLGLSKSSPRSSTATPAAPAEVTEPKHADKRGVSQKQRRRTSGRKRDYLTSSSGSLISAVVFPVSSKDVLANCFPNNNSSGSSSVTANNAKSNEEWPEFQSTVEW